MRNVVFVRRDLVTAVEPGRDSARRRSSCNVTAVVINHLKVVETDAADLGKSVTHISVTVESHSYFTGNRDGDIFTKLKFNAREIRIRI